MALSKLCFSHDLSASIHDNLWSLIHKCHPKNIKVTKCTMTLNIIISAPISLSRFSSFLIFFWNVRLCLIFTIHHPLGVSKIDFDIILTWTYFDPSDTIQYISDVSSHMYMWGRFTYFGFLNLFWTPKSKSVDGHWNCVKLYPLK